MAQYELGLDFHHLCIRDTIMDDFRQELDKKMPQLLEINKDTTLQGFVDDTRFICINGAYSSNPIHVKVEGVSRNKNSRKIITRSISTYVSIPGFVEFERPIYAFQNLPYKIEFTKVLEQTNVKILGTTVEPGGRFVCR